MTWSARVTKPDGSISEGLYCACQACLHSQKNSALPGQASWSPCNVSKMAGNVGSILTSIDVGADGHMAGGQADLRCNGFEPIPPEPQSAAPPQT